MLLELIFCRKVALLLLISPGTTTSLGPGLDALVYSTPLSIPLSAAAFARCDTPLPAVGEGLDSSPQVGGFCAQAAGQAANNNSTDAILTRLFRDMRAPLFGQILLCRLRWRTTLAEGGMVRL